MGVVYEVHDRQRDVIVALKTLLRTGAGDALPAEERVPSLADVTHPNLVRLYELFVDEAQWFFTMELVDGRRRFLDHVRDPDGPVVPRLLPAAAAARGGRGRAAPRRQAAPRHQALQRAGEPTGRVVLLDFGLVAECCRDASGETRT